MNKELKYNNFDNYPHYIFATAFLVNGKLADYKIGNSERYWANRTFRGSSWENEIWEHGFIKNDWELTSKHNKILVHNDEEHNKAFDTLRDWLKNNFEEYKKGLINWW